MTPYYEHAGITIYHGDCREILPTLPKFDLVLTDPPYGINAARDRRSQKNGWNDYPAGGWDKERPSDGAIVGAVAAGEACILWGGNYFTDLLPVSSKWLIWDKMQSDFSLADAELAWTSLEGAIRRFNYSRAAALQDGKQHATQKPTALMKWCLSFAPDAKTVLDPFLGSGTTLVACKAMGLQATGIEVCEEYCEIAAKRLRQEVFDFGTVTA